MSDKKFDLVFDAQLETESMKKALSKLNAQINKTSIGLTKDTTTQLHKKIRALQEEIVKIEGFSSEKLTFEDSARVSASLKKVQQNFLQLKIAMKDIADTAAINLDDFFPSAIITRIEKANKLLENYQSQLARGSQTKTYKEVLTKKQAEDSLRKDAEVRANRALEKKQTNESKIASEETNIANYSAAVKAATAELQAAKQRKRALEDEAAEIKSIGKLKDEQEKKRRDYESQQARTKQKKAVADAAEANKEKAPQTSIKANQELIKAQQDEAFALKEKEQAIQKVQALEAKYGKTQKRQEAALRKNEAAQEDVANAIQKAGVAQDANNKQLTNASSRLETARRNLSENAQEYSEASEAVKDHTQKLEELEKTQKILDEQFKKESFSNLVESFKQLGYIVPDNVKDINQLKQLIASLSEETRTKLQASLNQAENSLESFGGDLSKVGDKVEDFARSAEDLKAFNDEVDNMKSKITYFFGMSNAIDLLKTTIRSAFDTIKELDAAMTETAVVTDFSIDDMWNQLPRYTAEANKLGTTTLGAYETMTLFYQQGLNTNETFALGTETMKMARIAGLEYADATNLMTAALRGFNMELDRASSQRVNDVYSELAAITAADTEEIARAMTKTASIAHNADMEFETTAAFLSQIIETTRESAETAGTAMKTVIARFQELTKNPAEIGEVDGEIVDANKIEGALRSVGVSLRDASGQFRALDEVFLELASKWAGLDKNTQRYIATIAAGSRQQSRFLAMMSDYERTMELVNAANESAGASQKQFEKTTDSLKSKINQLKNAWDEFTMGVANSELVKGAVDRLTDLLTILNKITTLDFDGEAAKISSFFIKIFSAVMLMNLGKSVASAGFDTIVESFATKGEEAGQSFASHFATEWKKSNKMIRKLFKKTVKKPIEGGEAEFITEMGLIPKLGAKIGTALTNLFPKAKVFTHLTKGVGATATGLLSLVGIIGMASAALVILKKGFDDIYKSSPAGKFEAATNALEKAGEAAEEATTGYEHLKDSLDSLKNKHSIIEELAEGTSEWTAAISEANEELLKLVQEYPELAKFLDMSNPMWKLSEQAARGNQTFSLSNVLERFSKKVDFSQGAERGAAIREKEAERDKIFSELKPGSFVSGQDFQQDIVESIGEAIASGEIILSESSKISEEIGKWISENNPTLDDSKDYSFGMDKDAWITYSQALAENSDALYDLATSAKKNLAASIAKEDPENSKILSYFDKDYTKRSKELEDTLRRDIQDPKSMQILRSNYATQMGYQLENNKFYSGKGEDKVEIVLSDEDFIKQYTHGLLESEIKTDMTNFVAGIQELPGFIQQIYGVNKEKGLTLQEINRARTLKTEEYGFDPNSKIGKLFEGQVDNFVHKTQEVVNQQALLFAQAKKDLTDINFTDEEIFEKITRVSSGAATGFAKQMKIISAAEGEAGLEAVAEAIKTLVPRGSEEDFFQGLNSIDLTDVDSIENLDAKFASMGLDLNGSAEAVQAFEQTLIGAAHAVKVWESELTLSQIDTLTKMSTQAASEDDDNRVYSDEMVSTLLKFAPQLKGDFLRTSLDEYAYTGESVKTLKNLILSIRDSLLTDFTNSGLPEGQGLEGLKYSGKESGQEILNTRASTPEELAAQESALDGLIAKDEILAKIYSQIQAKTGQNSKLLKALTIDTYKAENSQIALGEALKDNSEIIKTENEAFLAGKIASASYYTALQDIASAAQAVFGDTVTEDFVAENFALFEKLQIGGQVGREAFESIREAISELQFQEMAASDSFSIMMDSIRADVASANMDFQVNGYADVSDLFNKLYGVYKDVEKTREAIEALTGMSVNFEMEYEEISVPGTIEGYSSIDNTLLTGGGNAHRTSQNKTIRVPKRFHAVSTSFNYNPSGFEPPSGGGGGSKEQNWKNPYDKLYNLTQKINTELRKREQLEKRYQSILQSRESTAEQLRQNSEQELQSLANQKKLQEQMLAERKKQASEHIANNSNMGQYASYDANNNTIQINWEAVNSVKDQDKGQAIEDYISKLEQIQDSINQTEDTLFDISGQIEEVLSRGEDEYLDLEQRVKEALVQTKQDEIDQLSKINDNITETNDRLLSSMSAAIEQQRQDRDNERTEEDLASKQRQLMYLSQDTSGANDMEILRLQKEIEQGQEDYTDALIDQKISQLQAQNDEAARQREKQITIAQAQLDKYVESGEIWNEVYTILEHGMDEKNGLVRGSTLETLLKKTENWDGMSSVQQVKWLEELETQVKQAVNYLQTKKETEENSSNGGSGSETPKEMTPEDKARLDELGRQWNEAETQEEKDRIHAEAEAIRKKYGYSGGADGSEHIPIDSESQQNAEEAGMSEEDKKRLDELGKEWNEAETQEEKDRIHAEAEAIRKKYGYSGGTDGSEKNPAKPSTPEQPKEEEKYSKDNVIGIAEAIMRDGGESTGWGAGKNRVKRVDAKLNHPGAGSEVQNYINDLAANRVSPGKAKKNLKEYYYAKFKKGGLANFTGPAWLDGTKSRPEIVLNAKDTENFIQLKDILSSLMSHFNGSTTTQNNGDNNYDIDINVENVSSDYDVEQIAGKIKSMINQDARYRNNNSISLQR